MLDVKNNLSIRITTIRQTGEISLRKTVTANLKLRCPMQTDAEKKEPSVPTVVKHSTKQETFRTRQREHPALNHF